MKIDMFNGQIPVGSAASSAAEVLMRRLDVTTDIQSLINNLTTIFNVAVDGVSGNVGI